MKRYGPFVKRFVLYLLLLSLVCSSVPASSSLYSKPEAGTLKESFQTLKRKISDLQRILQSSRDELMLSQRELARLEAELTLYQVELEEVSRELTRLSSSLENSQTLLGELRESLRREKLRSLTDKIVFSVAACVVGIGIGLLASITMRGKV